MPSKFHAHSPGDRPDAPWHLLREHLTSTGELAANFAAPFGGERLARLAGVLHDLGKYNPAFQRRLSGDPTRVDHSTAGAWMLERGELRPSARMDCYLARLVAYAIAGHHAGLADWDVRADLTPTGGELADRLHAFDPTSLDLAWRDEVAPDSVGMAPPGMSESNPRRYPMMMAMLCRMVFSCLVDADFKDTEAYFAQIEGSEPDRSWPALPGVVDSLIARLDKHMLAIGNAGTGELTSRQRQVYADRSHIHAYARSRATEAPGLFTLSVPTGGGKTLTSLGFALTHARAHGLQRIIYAIPFTSIIEQTARQFRQVLGDGIVLEHHSALEDSRSILGDIAQGRDKLRLAMEDWAAPVVVTTNVQLFESLFASRPSRCRKLHNIAGSVIVLDEAQALPLHLLAPCVRVIEELTERYGCSIVLCTATQPALDHSHFRELSNPDKVDIALPLAGRELAPEPEALAKRFRRVTVQVVGDRDDAQLVAEIRDVDQGLVIVNSRRHALDLYEQASAADLDGLIHLSTRQHAEDRAAILADIKDRLAAGRPCRVVATSLVEAGVDMDFPRVWRAEAGLEQIVQAAGRCNREGRRPVEDSIVTVFRSPEHPPPPELRQLAADFARMRDRHHDDLLSRDALDDYFRQVYWRKDADLDRERILDLFKADRTGFEGNFRTTADKFRMVESGMVPVIITNDNAERILDQLSAQRIRIGHAARRLQTRLVQVPPRIRAALVADGDVQFHDHARYGEQFAVLLRKTLYQPETGLGWERSGIYAADELIS